MSDRLTAARREYFPIIQSSLGPTVQELAKTFVLLLLLLLSVWTVLEILRAEADEAGWHERLWRTFAEAGRDRDGIPIAPRFLPAAGRSLAIVLAAACIAGTSSLLLGYTFALYPSWSVLRLPLLVASAVPAFMFFYLGVPGESTWFWPAVCLALGDLNAAALTAHCYNGLRRELNQPYVRTARAQGLPVWSDLWPRAVLVAIEGVRARIPHLLGGTVAIELAFNIHGIGQMALRSVLAQRTDYNVLIWIAGLGIVATRILSLVHRVAREMLTPERGRTAAWSDESSRVGIVGLWRGQWSGRSAATPLHDDETWLTDGSTAASPQPPSHWSRSTQRLRAYWRLSIGNRVKTVLAATTICLCGLVAVVALWGGGYSMLDTDAPSLPASRAHPLGTNENGEDVLATIALGGRELVGPVLLGVCVAIVLGGFFGAIAGLCYGSRADVTMDLYAELLESIPKIVLVLAALTYMSYRLYSLKLYLMMGLAFAPLLYRAVRDEVGALRTSLFLESALTLGVPRWRILWTHVLRNHVLPVLTVEGAVLVGYLLLYDAILGYCWIRQRGEVFTWGNLLGTGLDDLTRAVDAGIDSNVMIVWGPFAAMVVAIAGSVVLGDAFKSLGRSVRFSQ